ncbi:hypothetical protein [Streptomyces sp. NPDC047981]|uniref:hypothetical protein n=1 Tax=Streptomyces sp. NPDC047981 TaxID=3154610 RepID=UPI00341CF328
MTSHLATPASPNGCRWCGIDQRTHARQYTEQAGWHAYQAPTQEQVKTRMRARRTPQA